MLAAFVGQHNRPAARLPGNLVGQTFLSVLNACSTIVVAPGFGNSRTARLASSFSPFASANQVGYNRAIAQKAGNHVRHPLVETRRLRHLDRRARQR